MNEQHDSKFWRALHVELERAGSTLPHGAKPSIVPFPYPGEEWKETAQREEAEDAVAAEVDELITHYCQHQVWPNKSTSTALYFASERIDWGLGITRLFTIPFSKTGCILLVRPKEGGYALLEWLLIDAYRNRFPPPPPIPMYISGGDGPPKIVWR